MQRRSFGFRSRRAATVVLAAVIMIVLIAMVAFGVDIGYVVLVRTQLQAAADASAMAAAGSMGNPQGDVVSIAKQYAAYHAAASQPVTLLNSDVEFGTWDTNSRTFVALGSMSNAVRVTARRDKDTGGEAPFFFARIFGRDSFPAKASAVAMANPRDIAFVLDLSGSMNDDTEPAWATGEINKTFGPQGYPSVGNSLMQDVFSDFGFGKYPGTVQWIGEPLGVSKDKFTYAEMTKDGGPLTKSSISGTYRIAAGDSESTRKKKAYKWIIDKQIAVIMPKAKPAPNSSSNYNYWEKYLDYLMLSVSINTPKPPSGGGGGGGGGGKGGGGGGGGGPSPPPIGMVPVSPRASLAAWAGNGAPARLASMNSGDDMLLAMGPANSLSTLVVPQLALGAGPGTPPNDRGSLPPNQDGDRIDKFNNPNRSTFPSASSNTPKGYRNQIGYFTYVQFMMDFGRDLQPDGAMYSPLSVNSSMCPYHSESTAGGTFKFPPREQPTHAARRALIAAIQVVKERNNNIPDLSQRDWVSIVTYDTAAGTKIVLPLTGDYDAAMTACTTLQAAGDKGATTATESGLIKAKHMLKPTSEGGSGRTMTNKVVVLMTDGVPNLYESAASDINSFIKNHSSNDFYNSGEYWYDAPLMQAMEMHMKRWQVYPVGVGLGTDYGFMDRLGRLGGTAGKDGQSPRGSGNPAEYEQRLTEIFKEIITNPQAHLVQ